MQRIWLKFCKSNVTSYDLSFYQHLQHLHICIQFIAAIILKIPWKKTVKSQIEEHISKLKHNFKQPTSKVLQNADIKACLSDLHSKYVFVPADKALNFMIICKMYYTVESD